MMSKIYHRLGLLALTTALTVWGFTAHAQQDRPIDNAGRAVKRGFQNAGSAVQGSFVKTKTSVHNMEIVSRVYSRLHWDKALTTSNMELEVRDGGVAILTGIVPDAAARTKALTLTAETVGVIQVVDQVTVAVIGRPTAAPIVPGNPPVIVTPAPVVVTPPTTVIVPPDTPVYTKP